jgi:hypothetical protein
MLISGTVQLDRFTDASVNCVILSLISLRLKLLFYLSDILSPYFLGLLQIRDSPTVSDYCCFEDRLCDGSPYELDIAEF